MCVCVCVCTHFSPPARQNEVCVDILLPKLLGDVEAEGAVLVVDVAFGGIREDSVCVVDLLKLLGCFRIIGVFVGVELQRQFSGLREADQSDA